MDSLGNLLKEKREKKGVSISEASSDLNIKDVILENIEEGNIGSFKDIYVLKDYIRSYAKYLGLNYDALIDEFNEYLFEYTSKIPVKKIEQAMMEQNSKTEKEELKMSSPYTLSSKKYPKKYYVMIYAIIMLLILIVLFWSIKQITGNTKASNVISYIK